MSQVFQKRMDVYNTHVVAGAKILEEDDVKDLAGSVQNIEFELL